MNAFSICEKRQRCWNTSFHQHLCVTCRALSRPTSPTDQSPCRSSWRWRAPLLHRRPKSSSCLKSTATWVRSCGWCRARWAKHGGRFWFDLEWPLYSRSQMRRISNELWKHFIQYDDLIWSYREVFIIFFWKNRLGNPLTPCDLDICSTGAAHS